MELVKELNEKRCITCKENLVLDRFRYKSEDDRENEVLRTHNNTTAQCVCCLNMKSRIVKMRTQREHNKKHEFWLNGIMESYCG